MRVVKPGAKKLQGVAEGLKRAAAELPGGKVSGDGITSRAGGVVLLEEDLGGDGFVIQRERGRYGLAASTARGFLSGILNLAEAVKGGGDAQCEVYPRFTSRLYKHEAKLMPGRGGHTYIGDVDEKFWIEYAKTLVRNHFTGMVFYAHYHPFEFYLDFEEFGEATGVSAKQRAKTLAGLKRAFSAARAMGLDTFMQHYVTHFTPGLAKAHKLPIGEAAVDDGRLAAFRHPVVDAYSRYVYRRTFELLPELSGFYLNFESSNNSGDFIRRCLFPEMKKAKRPVQLVYRLWDFNSLPEMVKLAKDTPGKLRLAHKVMDRSDVYYYPKADPRVIEWKKALPDTEFMFLIGPCHNCATVQSSKMWADADFVQRLLADMELKGADSFAFHTVFDLLIPEIDWRKIAGERERDMALLNRGHLEAVIDYVRGRRTSISAEKKRLADRLGTDVKTAGEVRRAVLEGSQISLLEAQQHSNRSAYDSYLLPGRNSTYQEPFFYMTMCDVNNDPALPPPTETAWLARKLKLKNIPEEMQLVVDYVNPGIKAARRNPAVIARELERHALAGLKAAKKAAGRRPEGTFATLVSEATRNFNWGMRRAAEIRAAIQLYSVFFDRTRGAAVRHVEKAAAELSGMLKYMKADDPLSARRLALEEASVAEKDIRHLKRLGRHLKGAKGFQYRAFAAYVGSILAYGNARRRVRGNRTVDGATMRFIGERLDEAIPLAGEAVRLLEEAGRKRLAGNVGEWLRYLETERAEVKQPAMDVKAAGESGRDDGFVGMRHDQCLRYGENVILDMDGFFNRTDFMRVEPVSFRLEAAAAGLVVSLKEEGVDMKQRMDRWETYRGTASDRATEVLFFDREGRKQRVEEYRIPTKGTGLFRRSVTWRGRQEMAIEEETPLKGGKGRFAHDGTSWRLDYTIPWKLLGGRPKKGEKWRFNIAVCPAVDRNRVSSWCPGYDMRAGKTERLGTIRFTSG
ncbi:MAG: hypothetical protein JW909_00335 [Planctomycetes bacterium]|nr:hypothetical protein [Planctomycetota bacterium]